MVPSAYDAYPGFKELTGVVNGTGAPNAGTPDGGVKSFADVFTTPGDLAGPTGGFTGGLQIGLGGNPFALPYAMDNMNMKPGFDRAQAFVSHDALLNQPPVYTPVGGAKGAAGALDSDAAENLDETREKFTPTRRVSQGPTPNSAAAAAAHLNSAGASLGSLGSLGSLAALRLRLPRGHDPTPGK
jgi:hypothetical protein